MRIRFSLGRIFGILVLVLGFAVEAKADKTIMWLADWYQMGNIDTITTVQSVYIPHDSTTTDGGGYYYGTKDQTLTKVNAYAAPIPVNTTNLNATLPDSLHVPTEVSRSWYALPNFNTANYEAGRIRIYMNYQGQKHMLVNNNTKMQVDNYPQGTGYATGQTDQLEAAFVNNCIDKANGDTVWFWTGATAASQISSNASAASIKCLDHNPFFTKVGTVHLLNPWPGKTPYVELGGVWYPLYADSGRQGWVSTTFYADPRAPQDFKVHFASGNPATTQGVEYMDAGGLGGDASGTDFDFTAKPGKGGEVWVIPPTTTTKPTSVTTEPKLKFTLMIRKPNWSASALRVQWKGNSALFVAASTKYCSWFKMDFYEGAIPSSILLRSPLQDTVFGSKGLEGAPANIVTYQNWIDLTLMAALGGTQWLGTDNNQINWSSSIPASDSAVCATKVLAFSTYDYTDGVDAAYRYGPFAENNSNNPATDNCPNAGGGATKGLVRNDLNAAGRPVWTGKATCDISSTVGDGPQFWFDPLYKDGNTVTPKSSSTAKQLNFFKCMPLTLTLDPADGYYKYDNQTFFPLDTVKSIPTPYRPTSGNDFHFAMHAKAAFEYVPGLQFKFRGDDDVWIFINKKLALDIGGQHGPIDGELNLDKLGLVEGQSYQFDMFYSERHTSGSSIKINTTMNLVPTVDVNFDSTGSSGSVKEYKIWKILTSNDASVCPENGAQTKVDSGAAATATYTLVMADGSRINLSDSIAAIYSPGLTLSRADARITIDTNALKRSGKFVTGTYQIIASYETESRVVSFTVVSKNVNASATLYDRDGDGRADSVVIEAPTGESSPFAGASIAVVHWWDDSAKAEDSVQIAGKDLVRLSDTLLSAVFPELPFGTIVPPVNGGKGDMGRVWVTSGDSIKNAIVRVYDGVAPVADSAWLAYDTAGTKTDTLFIWTSEDIAKYTGTGNLPTGDSVWAILGNVTSPRPLTVEATAKGSLIKFLLPVDSNYVQMGDWVRLGGYAADAAGNAPGAQSRWVPIHSSPSGVAWMLDANGDGAPDSIGIKGKDDLSKAVSVTVHWTTALGQDTSFVVPVQGIAHGKGVSLGLPAGALKNATYATGRSIRILTSDKDTFDYGLLDSVPAAAVSAQYRFGLNADTLVVVASEVLSQGNAAGEGWIAQKSAGSAATAGAVVAGTGDVSGNTLRLVVDTGAFRGDSLRLRGWSQDLFGNAPGAVSPWVKVAWGPQAIRVILRDADGDGRADSAEFRLTRNAGVVSSVDSFAVTWEGHELSVRSLVRSADNFAWAGTIGPFALGTSRLDGDIGRLMVGGKEFNRAAVEDSVAPVAMDGRLAFGAAGAPDTLVITASERLKLVSSAEPVRLNSDSGETGAFVPTAKQVLDASASGTTLRLLLTAGATPDTVAWLRLGTSVSDSGGATVGARSRWVRLRQIPTATAWLYDADGDGSADSVLVRSRGDYRRVMQVKIRWSSAEGRDTLVPVPVNGMASFALPSAFLPGATASSVGAVMPLVGDTALATVALADSIAPIAIGKALYRYGTSGGYDTIYVPVSENVVPAVNSAAYAAVKFAGDASAGVSLSVADGYMDGGRLVLLVRPADWKGGDSLRLRERSTDAYANVPGLHAPFIPIAYGLPPLQASLFDPTGQGIASFVKIRSLRPGSSGSLAKLDSILVGWSDTDGKATTRLLATSSLSYDSATATWSGTLPHPFAQGATSCADTLCSGLAWAQNVYASVRTADSVAPVLKSAMLHFSSQDVGRDTLTLELSEVWASPDAAGSSLEKVFANVGGGNRSVPASMLDWSLSSDGLRLTLIVDTGFSYKIASSDSAWLLGRVGDAYGNHPGTISRHVPIILGKHPLQLKIVAWPPILKNGGSGSNAWAVPPSNVPSIEIMIRPSAGATGNSGWQAFHGGSATAPINDVSHLTGALITLNRPLYGKVYIYDQLGVAVNSIDLAPLADAWLSVTGDSIGSKSQQVWVAWNGTNQKGSFVASGVYLMRIVAMVDLDDGKRELRNIIAKVGWSRE